MSLIAKEAYDLLREGRLDEAKEAARQALSLNPDDVEALQLLALGYYHGGDFSQAAEILSAAIALSPSQAALHYNRAKALHGGERLEEAVAGYRKVLELVPGFAAAWNNLGTALDEMKNHAQAGEAYRMAYETAGQDTELCFLAAHNLGTRLFLDGRPVQAVEAFRLAAVSGHDPVFTQFGASAFEPTLGGELLSKERERLLLETIDAANATPPSLLPMAESYRGTSAHKVMLQGRRLSILSREFMHRRQDKRKYELTEFLVQSAGAAGLDLRCFMTDDITSWPDSVNMSPCHETLLALIDELREHPPELALMDGNFIGTPTTINVELMNELKQAYHFKLAILVPDTWGSLPFGDYWSQAADLLVTFNPTWQPANPNVPCVCVHVPHERNRPSPSIARDIDLSFTGYIAKRSLRACALALLQANGIDILLGGDDMQAPPLDFASFRQRLWQTRQTVDFSTRPGGSSNINGRVWEALGAGCLLHEQANQVTEMFLHPWRHYLPFSTARQLMENILLMRRHPAVCDKIAAQGRAWIDDCYPDAAFWQRILLALPSEAQ